MSRPYPETEKPEKEEDTQKPAAMRLRRLISSSLYFVVLERDCGLLQEKQMSLIGLQAFPLDLMERVFQYFFSQIR